MFNYITEIIVIRFIKFKDTKKPLSHGHRYLALVAFAVVHVGLAPQAGITGWASATETKKRFYKKCFNNKKLILLY